MWPACCEGNLAANHAIYSICEALNIRPIDFFTLMEEERLRLAAGEKNREEAHK